MLVEDMKDSSKTIKRMGLGVLSIQMGVHMKDSGRMIEWMAMENSSIPTAR